jgi:hypothetical protein
MCITLWICTYICTLLNTHVNICICICIYINKCTNKHKGLTFWLVLIEKINDFFTVMYVSTHYHVPITARDAVVVSNPTGTT